MNFTILQKICSTPTVTLESNIFFFDRLKHENMCEIIETNFNLLETYVRWCSIFFLMMTYKRNVIQVNEYVFNAY